MSDPHVILCCGCNRYIPEEEVERCPETLCDFCDGCWASLNAHEIAMYQSRDETGGVGCATALVFALIVWVTLFAAMGLVCFAIWGPWWE